MRKSDQMVNGERQINYLMELYPKFNFELETEY